MIVYALDAIQNPVSLFEPVYTEGGDLFMSWIRSVTKKQRRTLD